MNLYFSVKSGLLLSGYCVRQARPQPAADLKRGVEKLVAGFKAALGEGGEGAKEGERTSQVVT